MGDFNRKKDRYERGITFHESDTKDKQFSLVPYKRKPKGKRKKSDTMEIMSKENKQFVSYSPSNYIFYKVTSALNHDPSRYHGKVKVTTNNETYYIDPITRNRIE